MSAVKILLAGDCAGCMQALFKKAAAANKKGGPFNALLSFECPNKSGVDAESQASSRGEPPVPTFVLGCNPASAADAEDETSPQLQYLGAAGVKTIAGLTVAFLYGTDPADVATLRQATNSLEGEVDLLLTTEWPSSVSFGVAPDHLPEPLQAAPPAGSQVIADVATWVRPRYHVAAGHEVFFARQPYLNKDLGAGVRATRFVGLASISNTTKQKSLHALALVPSSAMSVAQLEQRPEGCTASPYDDARKRGAQQAHPADAPQGADWRWDIRDKRARVDASTAWGNPDVAKDSSRTVFVRNLPFKALYADVERVFAAAGQVVDIRRPLNDSGKLQGWAHVQFDAADAVQRALDLNGAELMGRELFVDAATSRSGAAGLNMGKPVDDCWFCLSGSNVDTSLIVSIGEEAYVALDKGAITPEHLLLVPIEHYPSTVSLPAASFGEMQRYLSALRSCYAASGKQLVGFERFLSFRSRGGNHTHLNVLAVPNAAAEGAAAAFKDAVAGSVGVDMVHVPAGTGGAMSQQALKDVVGDGEYFMALLPDGSQLVHPIVREQRWPMNLGREVLAELCGVPQRADWKACAHGEEQLGQMVARFKKGKEYDIIAGVMGW